MEQFRANAHNQDRVNGRGRREQMSRASRAAITAVARANKVRGH